MDTEPGAEQAAIGRGGAHAAAAAIGEIALLASWALVVVWPYLDPNPRVVTGVGEFFIGTISHYVWIHAQHCGACALWNGDFRGGAPAFVDALGAPLHPIFAVATMLFGVVNGTKATMLVSFFLAGLGQWFLGRALGLGRIARLWGAGMATTAGNLFGPLSGGLATVVTANVSFALLLAALVTVAQGSGRRVTVLCGILLALFMVSGGGYPQLGFALSLPVFAVLVVDRDGYKGTVVREFALAGGLALLLAGPFIVPFVHFLPHLAKLGDTTFSGGQPFSHVPLNLVISDVDYYRSLWVLGRHSLPDALINFVGWPAVGLAIFGLAVLTRRGQRPHAIFLGSYVLVALWLSSGAPFRWLYEHAGNFDVVREFTAGVRTVALIAGLSVSPLMALSAAGLDGLLRRTARSRPCVRLPRWLDTAQWSGVGRASIALLAILALLHLRSVGADWLTRETLRVESPDVDLAALHTPDLQWVQPPWGEDRWMFPAIERGYKIAWFDRSWTWRDRPDPTPMLTITGDERPEILRVRKLSGGLSLYATPPGEEYATIEHPDGTRTSCVAHGEGGHIDVTCDAAQPGRLVVRENGWSGWRASVDGTEQPLVDPGSWLAIDVPAGQVEARFRYRPWDVPLGFGLTIAGILLSGYWLTWPGPRQVPRPARSCAT